MEEFGHGAGTDADEWFMAQAIEQDWTKTEKPMQVANTRNRHPSNWDGLCVRLTAAEILSKALEEASIWLKLHNLKTVNPTVHTEMTSWPRVWMKPPARYVKCNVGCSWSAESQIGGGSSLVRDASRMALCHSRRMFSGISSELQAALVNFSWVAEATVNLKSGTDDHGTLHAYDSRFAHSLGDCPRVQYQDSKNMQLSPLL
ncbi:hypothetical protein DY000_02041188 [Brassica cretica]|uniref:Uncharacterized protein n=1 Tax=Brassica cretica TaxID=69181 RepID=A0ABQ7B7S5_BRACR|nr:hypothetical protein DY000_02041188 [Brassica cretica]